MSLCLYKSIHTVTDRNWMLLIGRVTCIVKICFLLWSSGPESSLSTCITHIMSSKFTLIICLPLWSSGPESTLSTWASGLDYYRNMFLQWDWKSSRLACHLSQFLNQYLRLIVNALVVPQPTSTEIWAWKY